MRLLQNVHEGRLQVGPKDLVPSSSPHSTGLNLLLLQGKMGLAKSVTEEMCLTSSSKCFQAPYYFVSNSLAWVCLASGNVNGNPNMALQISN